MNNYKQQEELIGNMDDEPLSIYRTKFDEITRIINDRLEELDQEIQEEKITPRVREYHQVRVDELKRLLKTLKDEN